MEVAPATPLGEGRHKKFHENFTDICTGCVTRAIDTVSAHLGWAPDRIALDATVSGDLAADSLDRIQLESALEDAFGLAWTGEMAPLEGVLHADSKTVRDAIEAVANARESQRKAA